MKKHSERAHSKFSASGAERWLNCPGSVALSEEAERLGLVPQSSEAAALGTSAHEHLESSLRAALSKASLVAKIPASVPFSMKANIKNAADHVLSIVKKRNEPEVLIEEKFDLNILDPEAFGTGDITIVEEFGTLDVMDYKNGKKAVSPVENPQLIFYGIGAAERYHWNFRRVRMTILQPNAAHGEPRVWEIGIDDLKTFWLPVLKKGVERVHQQPKKYFADSKWCYFCKGRPLCPKAGPNAKAADAFKGI